MEEVYVAGVQNIVLAEAARRQGRQAMTNWFFQGGSDAGWGPRRLQDRLILGASGLIGLL